MLSLNEHENVLTSTRVMAATRLLGESAICEAWLPPLPRRLPLLLLWNTEGAAGPRTALLPLPLPRMAAPSAAPPDGCSVLLAAR